MKAGVFGAAVVSLCLTLLAAYCTFGAQPAAHDAAQDILLQGKIQCSLKRQVLMPFKGVIAALTVQPGQSVKAGDVLARYTIAPEVVQQLRKQLSAPQIQDLEVVLTNFDKTLISLERKRSELKDLAEENMAPAQSLAQIQKEIQYTEQGRAAARQRLQLERDSVKDFEVYVKDLLGGSLKPVYHPSQPASLTAPITGNVISIQSDLSAGLEVGAGAPVFLIGVLDPMVMHAQIHESDMPKVALGDKAEATLESVPNRAFEARVSRLSLSPLVPGLEQPSYYDIEFTIPNSDHVIKEGFKGQIVLRPKPGIQ